MSAGRTSVADRRRGKACCRVADTALCPGAKHRARLTVTKHALDALDASLERIRARIRSVCPLTLPPPGNTTGRGGHDETDVYVESVHVSRRCGDCRCQPSH